MKKTTNYGPMKGVLKLAAGEVLEVKKEDEITHNFMDILKQLDGEEVSITIKLHEVVDE